MIINEVLIILWCFISFYLFIYKLFKSNILRGVTVGIRAKVLKMFLKNVFGLLGSELAMFVHVIVCV